MKQPKYWARFFLIASIGTAAMIFWFSMQKGGDSQAMSDPLTMSAARVIRPDLMSMTPEARMSFLDMVSTVIRKSAHFCVYLLLGFNLMGTMRFYFLDLPDAACRLRAMGIAVLYAASDELHQLFVSERLAQALDVLIDSAGSLTGTLLLTLCLAQMSVMASRFSKQQPQ